MGSIVIDFSYILNGQYKGTFKAGLDLAMMLSRKGISVTCVTGCINDQNYLAQNGLRTSCIFVPKNKPLALVFRYLYYILKKRVKDETIIYVGTHVLTGKHNSLALLHDLYVHDLPKAYNLLQYLYYKYLLLPSAMRHKCVVLSHVLKDRLILEYQKKGCEIGVFSYQALRLENHNINDTNKMKIAHTILMVTSGLQNKRMSDVLPVLMDYRNHFNKTPALTIVGRMNKDTSKLLDDARNCGFKAKFFTEITDMRLKELYYTSEWYLTTSLVEGFGLGTREAILSGCKVIAPCSDINDEVTFCSYSAINPGKVLWSSQTHSCDNLLPRICIVNNNFFDWICTTTYHSHTI